MILQAEKQKQVPATGLTHLQLLPPRYDPQVNIPPHIFKPLVGATVSGEQYG